MIDNNTQDALSPLVPNTSGTDNTQPAESQNVPNPNQEGLQDVDTIRQTIQQTQIEPVISFQYSSEGTTSSTISVDFTTMDDITGQSSTPANRHVSLGSQTGEEDSSSTVVSREETPPQHETTEVDTAEAENATKHEVQQIETRESECGTGQDKVSIPCTVLILGQGCQKGR